jgi:hypothetical protein
MKDAFYIVIILIVSGFAYYEHLQNKELTIWQKETVDQCVNTIAISHDNCLNKIGEFLGKSCDKI